MNRWPTTRWTITTLTAMLAGLLAVSQAASAQRGADPRDLAPRRGADGRNIAGDFDYYVLALSWSPTHCASGPRVGDDTQCGGRADKPYAFVLHGLWPQYAPRGWPETCPIRQRPFVPRDVINRMLDIMPSDRLVINQYRKHGTCSGLEPPAYFDLSRQLFQKIRIPERFQQPSEPQIVGPDEVIGAFRTVNPWLQPDMIAVQCGGPGNRLREVRVCFGKDGTPRSCTDNENPRRLCSASRLYVPPVRTGRPEKAPPRGRSPSEASPRAGGRDI